MKQIQVVNNNNQVVGYMVLNNVYHDLVVESAAISNYKVEFNVTILNQEDKALIEQLQLATI